MSSSSREISNAVTFLELFEALKGNGMDFKGGGEQLLNFILDKYSGVEFSDQEKDGMASKIDSFLKKLKIYWKECHFDHSFFVTKRREWLNRQLTVRGENRPLSEGRPKKAFGMSSTTTRKRKIKEVVDQHSLEELVFATEHKLRKCGSRDAANMLKEMVLSPRRGTKIKKSYRKSIKEKSSGIMPPEEALSLIVSSQLTTFQYSLIRKTAKAKKIELYPAYHAVLQAKKSCYPPGIHVDDYSAEIELQSNIDFTIKRFFMIPNEEIVSFLVENSEVEDLQYVVKWGCDGCGGLPRHKQKGNDAGNPIVNDSAILASSFVPLRLCAVSKDNNRILWQNPRSSSPRFCRPIRFRFVKETSDELVREISYIESRISRLVPTEVEVCGRTVRVIPKFLLTMIDGKVCNALASNDSTQTCYICGAKPKTMNLLQTREVNNESISWGLSPLHTYIRFMECILHISYRLEVPKWNKRMNPQEKEIVKKKKEKVISDFRTQTGLLIDTPKQGGGNTNDGNTARRFFADPVTSSQVTGIDKTLIERFGIILKTLASGQPINTMRFEQYTSETAKLYVDIYNWYPMPVTVHKILLHSSVIIKKHIIPIGQLAEDVIEIQHKLFKRFREHHSRKMSRTKTNIDVLHNLIISTDPLITSLRHLPPPKDVKKLDKAVIALLTDEGKMLDFSDSEETSDSDIGLSNLEL